MSLAKRDLRWYFAAGSPESDSPTGIGGAIDTSLKPLFTPPTAATMQGVSENTGDTTQNIQVSYRDSAGALQTATINLNGRTVVTNAAVMQQILKAVKSATCAGNVALESQTATRSNTAQSGAADRIVLDASASSTDDAYVGQVIRITGGTGQYQIREIVQYIGSSKTAIVDQDWSTNPDNTSTFRIAQGAFFEKSPSEVMTVRRMFYAAAPDVPSGSARKVYDKLFVKNCHASIDLLVATIAETSDPQTLVAFALEASLDGSDTNGGGNNRLVAPGGYTFNSTTKNVANSQTLTHGTAQGVWAELSLAAGALSVDSTWAPTLSGQAL